MGGSRYFDTSSLQYLENIILLNVKAVSFLSHILLPRLREHPKGYILNVGSMAALSPIGFKTIYPASKAFVLSFSRSLNEELKGTGITVSVVLPGPMRTNPEITSRINQQGWWVRKGLLPPEVIAKGAVEGMLNRQKVIIPGFMNKVNCLLIKLLPVSLVSYLITMGIKREITEEVVLDDEVEKAVG